MASSQQIGAALTGPKAEILSLAFGADGETLASGDALAKVIVWDVSLSSWRARACTLVARILCHREWSRYRGQVPYQLTCPEFPPGQGD